MNTPFDDIIKSCVSVTQDIPDTKDRCCICAADKTFINGSFYEQGVERDRMVAKFLLVILLVWIVLKPSKREEKDSVICREKVYSIPRATAVTPLTIEEPIWPSLYSYDVAIDSLEMSHTSSLSMSETDRCRFSGHQATKKTWGFVDKRTKAKPLAVRVLKAPAKAGKFIIKAPFKAGKMSVKFARKAYNYITMQSYKRSNSMTDELHWEEFKKIDTKALLQMEKYYIHDD